MRHAITIAALAVGALAVPYKREVVTNVDIVYVTNVVTVTAEGTAPTAEPKPKHYGHHNTWTPAVQSTVVTYEAPAPVATSSSAPAPVYSSPAPVYSSPAPVYSAPAPVYSSPAPVKVSSAAPAGAAPTDYQSTVLYHHNIHRANHSAPDVQWDADLESSAATIAASCVYAHNTEVGGGGYGQNIAAGVEAANVSSIITDMFYNGEEPYYASNYGMANPDMTYFEKWGHFSQIVWKSTTHVACATQYCPNGLGNVGSGVSPYFTVCNYKGPGNFAGEYNANVLAPLGHATANWNFGFSLSGGW